jgi:Fe-S oxidoreductase
VTPTLEADQKALDYCTYCPKLCRQACPVSNVLPREALIPQQKMETANLLRLGHLPWRREYTEPLYGCTGCGACTSVCAWRNEPGRVLMIARGAATERRAGHPALERLEERLRLRSARLAGALRALVPATRRGRDARVAYHPACDTIAREPADLAAALHLIDRVANYVRVVDTDEPCGGYPLWAAGDLEALRSHGRRFAAELARHGKVVSSCPACVWLVQVIYPRMGIELRPEVAHITEFLEASGPALPQAPAGGAARVPTLYHDPCFLGRQLGVYDPPRRLLARVAEVREFSRAREESECSGGGGLVPQTMPEVARGMAVRRLRETHEPGMAAVTRVATACPTCKQQLAAAPGGIEVRDVVTLLAEASGWQA